MCLGSTGKSVGYTPEFFYSLTESRGVDTKEWVIMGATDWAFKPIVWLPLLRMLRPLAWRRRGSQMAETPVPGDISSGWISGALPQVGDAAFTQKRKGPTITKLQAPTDISTDSCPIEIV